ncbi:MAG: histidine kinase [Gorillibacterium sp.]|nr:histidine kinase [Gorillibacterium sp.]
MDWMSRFSFYRRIQLSFLFFILLPFIVVTFWSYSSVKHSVIDKITRSNEDMLRVISNQVTKTIDSISFASVYFSESYDTNVLGSLRSLKVSTDFSDYDTYAHYSRLKAMSNILSIQSMDANLKVFILNQQGRLIMGNLEQPVFSTISDPNFTTSSEKLDDKETTVLQWFSVKGEPDAPSYYYAAKVIDDPRNHERLATLFIGIPDTYLRSLFDTFNHSGSIVLTDREGRIMAATGKEDAPQSTGIMLVSEQIVPKVGWKITHNSPRSAITGQINHEFFVSISIVSLFFAVFLFFSVVWAGRINKPISQLRTKVKQYVGGNRSVRMPVKGKDEVALLSTAFNHMLDDINHLLHQVESEQEEKRVLELQALVAQIRPHFLLNTLNSIKVNLIMAGDGVHSGMIDSLMTLLRAYVRVDEPIELTEERKLLASYIQVMQIRNRMDIRFICTIAEEAESIKLPRLLLQPIVENAIIHGFALHPVDAEIQMNVELTGDMLEISISDNGRGLSTEGIYLLNQRLSGFEQDLPSATKGVGLVNTARRLQVFYGLQSRLQAAPNPNGGLVFVLRIPYDKWKGGVPAEYRDAD